MTQFARRRLLVTTLPLLFLAGCGTTVPLTTQRELGAGGSTGAGLGTTGTQPGSVAGGATTGSGASSTSGSATGGTTGLGSSGGSSGSWPQPAGGAGGGAGGSSTLANGPGVTATTITVGVTYYQSAGDANSALGANGVNQGNPGPAVNALRDDINAHGGIAGRKLVLLAYAVDPQSSQSYATLGQAVCSYFTEDHKVLAVIDGTPAADARACLEKRRVAHLGATLISSPITQHDFAVVGSRLLRVYRALPTVLQDHGWFGPWDRTNGKPGTLRAKTGIVTVDSHNDNEAIDHALVPALSRLGYAPAAADIIRITPPTGFSDDGAVVAAIQSAVLKLNADGVDHVILNDGNGSLSLFFHRYALSQHYFPRYGGTSGSGWQVLLSSHNMEPQTLAGAMGIGWQPPLDLPYQNGDGQYPNAARHRCFAVLRAAGSPPTDAASAGGAAEVCDVMQFIPTALRGYRGPVDLNVLTQRIEALGTSYPLASGLASRVASDQHDVVGGYSFMFFDSGCGCVKYQGPVIPTPH
jgi:ABC-type branched-subunit amino acid transport system substrate-binding protein